METFADLDLMQDYQLTVDRFLSHAAKWHGNKEIVSVDANGLRTTNYSKLLKDAKRLSLALLNMGLKPGDCVATLAWNTLDHLAMLYATMSSGLICHTLNPRLHAEQLSSMVNQAQGRVLAIGSELTDTANILVNSCPSLKETILLDGERKNSGQLAAVTIDSLISSVNKGALWGDFNERNPAGLCFTSGTSGDPKGVLYSHRSNYLHTLRVLQSDVLGITEKDVVMIGVPMFHANAWGFPFAAPAVGAKLVLPGRIMTGPNIAELINSQGVTISAGVPTLWLGLLEYVEKSGITLPSLQRIVLGGASCAQSLIDRLETGLGVRVQTSWGMTELSPSGTISLSSEPAVGSGKPAIGLDLKLTDAEGNDLAEQRNQEGYLKVKGASVVSRYFAAEEDAVDDEGWFDTGDLATINKDGFLTITGRAKDLIKSGGEWINPAVIEEIIGQEKSVSLVAVISKPHPKWGERPLLIVQSEMGSIINKDKLLDALRRQIPAWWIPDTVIQVESMPMAATGKINKAKLYAEYALS